MTNRADITGTFEIPLDFAIDGPTDRHLLTPELVCVGGPDLGRRFRVSEQTVIGRESAEVELSSYDISRRHARITAVAGGYVIEDLGSQNGTSVNGSRITERHRLQVGDHIQLASTTLVFTHHDELAARTQQLQRLEAMGMLASGIAHDFNNTLAVIRLALDEIAEAVPADAVGAQESLLAVQRATDAGSSLARRLMRIGRAEPLSIIKADLGPIVAQTVKMARAKAAPGTELRFDVPDKLGILAAPDEVLQVLLNLLLNAFDAMPQGGHVSVVARALTVRNADALRMQVTPGEFAQIVVADTGTGMDEATLARAFEPFFTTKPRDKGTGLGLAMIHASVRRHGGAIEVQSKLGVGTSFTLYIPRV